MLLAWGGEELGTPPHWEGASLVPDAPPSSRTLLRSIGGHPRGEAEDVVGSICEYEIAASGLASRLSSSWLGQIAVASGCRQLAGLPGRSPDRRARLLRYVLLVLG